MLTQATETKTLGTITRTSKENRSNQARNALRSLAVEHDADQRAADSKTRTARTFMADLLFEHIYMGRILQAFENHLIALRKGKSVDYGIMHEVMHYIVHFPDVYHHPREHLLFQRMQARDPALGDIVRKLEREHEIGYQQGRRLLKLMETARDTPKSSPKAEILSRGERYVQEMRAHMKLEETVMIPQATKLLTEEDFTQIRSQLKNRMDSLLAPPLNAQDHPGLLAQVENTVKSVYTEASRLEFLQSLVLIDAVTELGVGTRRMANIIQDEMKENWTDYLAYQKSLLQARSPLAWWSLSYEAAAKSIQRQRQFRSQLAQTLQKTLVNTMSPILDQLKSLSEDRSDDTGSLPTTRDQSKGT